MLQRNKKKQFPHFYSFVFYIAQLGEGDDRTSRDSRALYILIKICSFTFTATAVGHLQAQKSLSVSSWYAVNYSFTMKTIAQLDQWGGCFLNTPTTVTAGTQTQGRIRMMNCDWTLGECNCINHSPWRQCQGFVRLGHISAYYNINYAYCCNDVEIQLKMCLKHTVLVIINLYM